MPSSLRKGSPSSNPAPLADEGIPRLLLAHLDADASGGALRVNAQRLLLVRPEALVDLQKHLEDTLGLSSKGFLYLAGEKSAREGHDLLAAVASPGSGVPFEAFQQRINAMSGLGWGLLAATVEDVTEDRYLVTVEDSAIAEAYGESKKAVCHLLAGWIAGTAQSTLGRNLLCEETVCRAQGKPRCEFRLRPTPYG